jgi:hypothetical protein
VDLTKLGFQRRCFLHIEKSYSSVNSKVLVIIIV